MAEVQSPLQKWVECLPRFSCAGCVHLPDAPEGWCCAKYKSAPADCEDWEEAAPEQCKTCLWYILPAGDGWCYMFEEPPDGECKQRKGGGE